MFIDPVHGKQLFEVFHGTVHFTAKQIESSTQQQRFSHVCRWRNVDLVCAQLYDVAILLAFNLTQCSLVRTVPTKWTICCSNVSIMTHQHHCKDRPSVNQVASICSCTPICNMVTWTHASSTTFAELINVSNTQTYRQWNISNNRPQPIVAMQLNNMSVC